MSPTDTTAAQEAALPWLAAGWTYADAGKIAGVVERTVQRWMADPEFRRQVDELSDSLLDQTCRLLGDAGRKAVERLSKLVESESEKTALAAARALVSLVLPLQENRTLARRVAELEAIANRRDFE